MTQPLDDVLSGYLEAIAAKGSLTPRVLRGAGEVEIGALAELDRVALFDDLRAYLRCIGGYDQDKCDEFNLFEPELAWGMFALDLKHIPQHYGDLAGIGEDPEYYPFGFLPLLWDGSGSYVAVNCIARSPTYGAVYDMSEGVGCNQISPSLGAFFAASRQETELGLRTWERGHSTIAVNPGDWLSQAGSVFGRTPFFARVGRMDTQIVDWN